MDSEPDENALRVARQIGEHLAQACFDKRSPNSFRRKRGLPNTEVHLRIEELQEWLSAAARRGFIAGHKAGSVKP